MIKNIKNGDTNKITMQSIISNAISEGTTFEQVANVDYVEQIELSRRKGELKGEIKND